MAKAARMAMKLEVTFDPPPLPATEGGEDTCYHCFAEGAVQRIEANEGAGGWYCINCLTEALLLLQEHDGEVDPRMVVDFEAGVLRTDKALPDSLMTRLIDLDNRGDEVL